MSHTVILHDPFEDPKDLPVPARSPSPSEQMLKSSRIGIDEKIDPDADLSDGERQTKMDEKEAKARAHILEMIGDLHDADDKPPDNVLFVCKLNPVTVEDDLEIIFGRFGKIKCCEVIRDRRSGLSLHYAFIEYEDARCCEAAYFKMDNVLIDDRRIHVDFSQSVAKNYTWNKKANKDGATQSAPPPPSQHARHGGSERAGKSSRTEDTRRTEHTSHRRQRSRSPRRREHR